MPYQIISCPEGEFKSTYDPNQKVVDFYAVTSCLTLTVILDSSIMCAAHAVAAASGNQKSWPQLRAELGAYVKKYRKNSCSILAAGALMGWQSDLSGPIAHFNPNIIDNDEHDKKIAATLRKWFPNAKVSTASFADCHLYSGIYRENGNFHLTAFDETQRNQWQMYSDYAPAYAGGMTEAFTANRRVA